MGIFGQLKDKITRYIDINVKLVKINLIEKTSNIAAYFIFAMILLFIVFCILLFLGFGLSELFVDLGLSRSLSFFITLGIFLLLFIIALALRRKITRFFAGKIVRVITENEEEQQDED